eukprot:CAMPEP_0206232428 /NCGR_PEP_ID=MMETSP0047_2-20121206/11407_1 /ASSEMBLY_ACC=CAM_ASM_000192 /TAXON_ID=195065 /ORGANISM="Chroomonas mesostigmatica_cf, Strain CCMP1168" /LENGTH=590 /DNA_ID=CAMNT_0053656157 /DNA_START=179 /DNA_END=1948 /DNA_ORIENTATION=+
MIDPDDRYGWIVLSYCLCIFFIVAFGVYGITYAIFLGRREAVHATAGSAEQFTTAKRSQGVWRIGWSFFCAAIGGWVISSPANFSTWGGYIMLITYPISTGIPILIIAYCGNRIIEKYPMCCSLGDFVAWRWGPTAKLYVACVTMLNMAIFLLAELTLIGALFESYVGDRSYPIIIVTSVVTTIYTAYGGLLVSIITDQAQAIFSVIILLIISIYLCVEFRQPLPENFGGNDALGAQFYGYSSILTLPVSLVAATAFSEQVWQRCWASESPQTLRRGAWIGFISVTIFVFLAGFFGYMAAWSGLIDFENTNVNVYLFQVFKRSPSDGGYTVNNWITVLVLILAAIMNESAVDSILNGMVATVSSQFFRGQGLFWCRILTFVIMIPIVVLATQQYGIDQIFLLGNILCSCGFIPLYLGLVDHPKAHFWLSESNLLFSFSMAILTVTAYGMARMNSFTLGAEMAWWLNSYSWDYFAVSTFTSVGYMIFFAACKEALARFGIQGTPISEITMKIPGFKFLAGHWEQDIDVEGDATHAAKLAKLGPDSPPTSGIADPVAEPYLKSPPTAPYAQYYPQYAGAAPPPTFHMMQKGV